MSRPLILAAITVACAAPAAVHANEPAEQKRRNGPAAELVSGIEYKEGTYGTSNRLETLSAPTTVRVFRGQLQLSASVPYLRIEGPGNLVGGGGLLGLPIIADPTRPTTRSKRQGVGDLRAAAAYTVPTSKIGLTFSGEVKLPTASRAKGLGTGATDVSMGAEVWKSVGPVTPFVTVAYTLPGDAEGLELRDALAARAGAAVRVNQMVRAHLAYGHAQSLSREFEEERQVSTGLSASLSQAVTLGFHGSAGLSSSAPDFGAGIQLGFRIR